METISKLEVNKILRGETAIACPPKILGIFTGPE